MWGDGESLTAEPQFPEVSSSWQWRAPGETAQSSHLDDEGRGRGKCSLCCSSSLQLWHFFTSHFNYDREGWRRIWPLKEEVDAEYYGGWQERPSCWYLGPTWPGRSLKVREAVELTQATLHFYVSSQQNPNLLGRHLPTAPADHHLQNRTSSRNILG